MDENVLTGQVYTCSFCGKRELPDTRLVTGPQGVAICAECVRLCSEIIGRGQPDKPAG